MIPVVPIAFAVPAPQFRPPPQRASDADRDTAVDMLCAAVADGRLALSELDGRVAAALSARTLTELAALIADLHPLEPMALASAAGPAPGPTRVPGPAVANEGSPARARGDRPAASERGGGSERARGDRPGVADRWSLLQSLAAG